MYLCYKNTGLVWSLIVEKTLFKIIITAHGSGGKVYDLRSAAVVVNLHRGISGVFIMAFTYAIDAYRGRLDRLLAVVFSTTACILGLIYIFLAGKEQLHLWPYYLDLVVMASAAQAGLTVTLKEIFDNQFRPMHQEKLFWNIASLLATIFAHSEKLVLLLIIVTVCFIFVFFLSSHSYVRATSELHHNNEGRTVEMSVWWLWVCLLILSVVSASGSTFFFSEDCTPNGDYLKDILSFDYWLRVAKASSFAFKDFGDIQRLNQDIMEFLRIGIPLLHLVVWCAISLVMTAMSVYWLTLHCILMGVTVGLAKTGFQWLYESQAVSHLKRYGWALGELAGGLGCLLSILCIFVFPGGDFSGMYNVIMAGLSVFNIILYLAVAFWYMGEWTLSEDQEGLCGSVEAGASTVMLHFEEGALGHVWVVHVVDKEKTVVSPLEVQAVEPGQGAPGADVPGTSRSCACRRGPPRTNLIVNTYHILINAPDSIHAINYMVCRHVILYIYPCIHTYVTKKFWQYYADMYLIKEILFLFPELIIRFKKSILFIVGLIWSFKFVEKTFFNILITRQLAAGMVYDLRSSVVAVNSLELISVVVVVISTYATKVCKGRFLMVLFSATVFIVVSSYDQMYRFASLPK
ncbi:hypothetical protein SASPL_106890 [Salvia splendens]|uniref:Uncharacterized protein n=1 Tax=Salvia splendens TaxID=180675 RepID=A0A8X8YFH3_SALSN|nr:hypothetical protein SASPL_106890 [Salvia splendens]